MDTEIVDELVADWDEVYKKGQLSLWILLAISDERKYAAQITDFMHDATNGTFEVKEQSLYRALRRFSSMGLVTITEVESPSSGTKRKYYQLSERGQAVLGRFITIHIAPLLKPPVNELLRKAQTKGNL